MGKYDKEIKKAEKIGADWIEKSESYQAQFESIKKNHVKLEKSTMNEMQEGIKKGDHLKEDSTIDYAGEIDRIQDNLDMFMREGQRLFDEHERWSLVEPRKSMFNINKELELGGVDSEAYKAVSEGIKNMLIDVAKVIKATQQAWNLDLKPALETQFSRLEGLREIILEGGKSQKVYIQQIKKQTVDFCNLCDSIWRNVGGKVKSHVDDLKKALTGELAGKDKKSLQNQYEVYKGRLTDIPKTLELVEKNHKRVLKSVPESFVKGFMVSHEKKEMDEKEQDLKNKMLQARSLYEKLVAAYESKGLVDAG